MEKEEAANGRVLRLYARVVVNALARRQALSLCIYAVRFMSLVVQPNVNGLFFSNFCCCYFAHGLFS